MKPQFKTFSKMLVAAGIAVTTLTSAAFAAPIANSNKLSQKLAEQFKDAKDISWKETTDYTKATFKINDQQVEVFYNNDGEYLATGRTTTADALPLKAYQSIKDKYSDYTVTNTIEYYDADDILSYYVSLNKDNSNIILHVAVNGDISIFKK